MDFARLRQGEIVAAIAGLALIIFLFLPWYGAGDENADGWDSLTDFDGFLIAAAGVAGIALAALAAVGRRVNLGGLPRGYVTAALGALASALIVWRLFAQPFPGADLEFGIFLGLAAAIGVAVGAVTVLREGGFDPLPLVPGGRTRAAPAAAPSTPTPTTTTPAPPAATTRRAAAATPKRSSGTKTGARRANSSGSKSSSGRGKSSSSRSKSSSGPGKSTGSRSKSSSSSRRATGTGRRAPGGKK